MQSFWKTILLVVVVLGVLGLLTYFNSGMRVQAIALARDSHLPIWLVGLFAPFVYLWKKVFHSGVPASDLDRVVEENKRLKLEQGQLRQDVKGLVEWREQELAAHRAEIARLEKSIAGLQDRVQGVQQHLTALQNTSLDEFSAQLGEEEKTRGAEEYFKNIGVGVSE